jgi:hypothetical protein
MWTRMKMRNLNSSVTACKEIARLIPKNSWPNLGMIGAIPEVETVIFRFEKLSPELFNIIRNAAETLR